MAVVAGSGACRRERVYLSVTERDSETHTHTGTHIESELVAGRTNHSVGGGSK